MKIIWEGLSENLQKEETIMGYRNTAQNLRKLYLQNWLLSELMRIE